MKDTLVKEGYWAYMLRVDCLEQGDSTYTDAIKCFHEWKQKYDCVYYIIGKEISEKGKIHLQSIVWFESEQDKSKLRNWWKSRSAKTKQSVAFTSAKKVKNLAKYSMKDNNYVTNLHNDEIQRIGKWETAKQKRELWSEQLFKYAEQQAIKIQKIEEQHQQGNWWCRTEFLCKLLDYYKKHNKRPNRATLQYLSWKLNFRSNRDLLHDMNLLSY